MLASWPRRTARLWAAGTGELVASLRGPISILTAAAFGADSITIVTAERNGTVRQYICDIRRSAEQLLTVARARLAATGRTLTPEERRRYPG